MKRKRKKLTLKTQLAACLRIIGDISHEERAPKVSDDMIIRRFQWHHAIIPHAAGGPDKSWNLEPVYVSKHKEITRKVTVPQLAKDKRIAKKWDAFTRKMNDKAGDIPEIGPEWFKKAKWVWPKRKFNNRRKKT